MRAKVIDGMMYRPRVVEDYDIHFYLMVGRLLMTVCGVSLDDLVQSEQAERDGTAESMRWTLPDHYKNNVQLGRVVIAKQQRLNDRHRVIKLERAMARNVKRTMPHVKVLKAWTTETWSLTDAGRKALELAKHVSPCAPDHVLRGRS